MCNVIFQVTVAYSMHTGYLDKAVKYTEKALAQIEKIRGVFIYKIHGLFSFKFAASWS